MYKNKIGNNVSKVFRQMTLEMTSDPLYLSSFFDTAILDYIFTNAPVTEITMPNRQILGKLI